LTLEHRNQTKPDTKPRRRGNWKGSVRARAQCIPSLHSSAQKCDCCRSKTWVGRGVDSKTGSSVSTREPTGAQLGRESESGSHALFSAPLWTIVAIEAGSPQARERRASSGRCFGRGSAGGVGSGHQCGCWICRGRWSCGHGGWGSAARRSDCAIHLDVRRLNLDVYTCIRILPHQGENRPLSARGVIRVTRGCPHHTVANRFDVDHEPLCDARENTR